MSEKLLMMDKQTLLWIASDELQVSGSKPDLVASIVKKKGWLGSCHKETLKDMQITLK